LGSDSESSDISGNNGDGDDDIEIQKHLYVTCRQPFKFINYLPYILADVFHEIYKVCRTIFIYDTADASLPSSTIPLCHLFSTEKVQNQPSPDKAL